MPNWVDGGAVLLEVDISSTFTPLSGEITARLERRADVRSTVNKQTGTHKGKGYGLLEDVITLSGHLNADTKDAALAELQAKRDARQKASVRYVVPNPYDTYTGSAVVAELVIEGGAGDDVQVSGRLEIDGVTTVAATT